MSSSKIVLNAAAGIGGAQDTIAFVPAVNVLIAYDCADPTSISELGRITDTTNLVNAHQVVVDINQNIACVSCNDRITFIDISDPTNMTYISHYSKRFEGMALDTTNKILYGVDRAGSRLYSLDVSDVANFNSTLDVLDNLSDTQAFDISYDAQIALDKTNDVLYVPSYLYLTSIDVSTPSSLSILQKYYNNSYPDLRGVALDVTRDTCFGASYADDRIVSFNISNPSSISVRGTETNSFRYDGLARFAYDEDGQDLYGVAIRDDAVTSTDVSTLTSPSLQNSLVDTTWSDSPQWVVADTENSTIYVGSQNSNDFISIDISDPTNMSVNQIIALSPLNYVAGLALNKDDPSGTQAYT